MTVSPSIRAGAALALLAAATPAAAERTPVLPYALAFETADAAARAAVEPEQARSSGPKLHYVLLDRFEWAPSGDSFSWDVSALFGSDTDRVYFGSSGDGAFSGGLDYLELNAFYSRHIGGDWDLNAGLRADLLPHPNRFYGALGAQYDDGNLWVGAWTYLSTQGELSARLAAYYNLKLAGKLFLQPSFELDAFGEDIPALGIGRGFAYAEAGLRMRYEIIDHFAPYVGLSWSRDLGRTARIDRAAGEDPETKTLVLGVRSEF